MLRLCLLAGLATLFAVGCVSTSKTPPAVDRPARLTVRAIEGYQVRGGEERKWFVTFDGKLVVQERSKIVQFQNEGSIARPEEEVAVGAIVKALHLPESLPEDLRKRICILSRMNVPEDVFAAILFPVGGDVFRITRDNGFRATKADKAAGHPIYRDTYWVEFEDVDTPVFHFYTGEKEYLFGGGTYDIGYTWPFRFREECLVLHIWSQVFPDEDETRPRKAHDDLALRCGSLEVDIPAAGKELETVIEGFDGSTSVVMDDGGRLVWYHIR